MTLLYILAPVVTGVLTVMIRYRKLLHRDGDIPVRVLPAGSTRWVRGHAVWVHDVFAFRHAPAAWKVSLLWVTDILKRAPTSEERKKLHRLGDDLVVGTLRLNDDVAVDVATRPEHGPALVGETAKPHDGATPDEVIHA